MAKKKSSKELPSGRPATNPKDREDELINLAVNLAEQQLRDGTASTQVIVHYLKLGSTRGIAEQRMLEKRTDLLEAQTESLQSSKKVEEMYAEAMAAMQRYSGMGDKDVEL